MSDLVKYVCPLCNKLVVVAIPGIKCFCSKCGKWFEEVKEGPSKKGRSK